MACTSLLGSVAGTLNHNLLIEIVFSSIYVPVCQELSVVCLSQIFVLFSQIVSNSSSICERQLGILF